MKLDPRIKSLSDILTCFNIEDAKQYIDQKGYFSDTLCGFSNLSSNRCYNILTDVRDDGYPFRRDNNDYCCLFIPESRLLENKKYSRPFSIIEFKGNLPKMIFPDDLIHFRNKDTGLEEYAQRYNGYIVNSQDTVICLGSREYSLKDLFEKFEYLDKDGDWLPFGVEE